MQGYQHSSQHRFLEIDFIRAIAVVLMVFTHTAMYFYDFSNPVFSFLSDLGGYLCFSLFLFDSGVTVPIGIAKHSPNHEGNRLLKRGLIFMALYVIFGMMFGGPQNLPGLIFLQEMPIFADFIFGLAVFFFLGALITPYINKENILLMISTSIIMLFIGFNLYFSDTSNTFLTLKGILFGEEGLHRFPILQYSLVYLSGIAYGIYREELTLKKKAILGTVLAVVTYVAYSQWGFERWQATPAFILTGITVAVVLMLIWELVTTIDFRYKQRITNYIVRLSKTSAGVLVFHLLIIFGLSLAFNLRFNALIVTPIAVLILISSSLLGEKIRL